MASIIILRNGNLLNELGVKFEFEIEMLFLMVPPSFVR